MKRRKNRGAKEDAGRRPNEGRAEPALPPDAEGLSATPSEPKRPSAPGRSSLVPEGSRWLRFSRRLAHGRGRLTVADTPAFIGALYGEKFKTAEGAPFSQEKVYRKAAGGRFVSETRLSIDLRTRFDLRVLNLTTVSAVSYVTKESLTGTHSPHAPARGRADEQPLAASPHIDAAPRYFQTFSTVFDHVDAAHRYFQTISTAHDRALSPIGARGESVRQSAGSWFGGKFASIEGGTLAGDKVFRKAAGAVFTSETRLRLSVRPRFDLRVLNVIHLQAVPQVLREVSTKRTLHLPTPARVGENEPPLHPRRGGNSYSRSFQTTSNAFYQTVSTGSVLLLRRTTPAVVPPTMSLPHAQLAGGDSRRTVTVHTSNAMQARRSAHGDTAAGVWVETRRPSQAEPRASRQFNTLELRRPVPPDTAREFVRAFLQTALLFKESREINSRYREILSLRTTRDFSGVTPGQSTAAGEMHTRFTQAQGEPGRQLPGRTFAVLTQRQTTAGTVEKSREFRASERVEVQATATHAPRPTHTPWPTNASPPAHAPGREPWPGIIQVRPHTPLQIALTNTSLTVMAGGSAISHRTSYESGGRGSGLLLQHPRTVPTMPCAREVLPAPYASAGRVHTTSVEHQGAAQRVVEQPARGGVAQIGSSPFFILSVPGAESAPRLSLNLVQAQHRNASTAAASGPATSRDFHRGPAETPRTVPGRELPGAVSATDLSVRILRERTAWVLTSPVVAGAGNFLFSSGLPGRMRGFTLAIPGALPHAAGTRTLVSGGAARAAGETAASRPEGMALELVRQRRDDVLRLPPLGYVFTQPARPQLEERQVITRASREEIVEVVRREVRALATTAPAVGAASRADFAGLADEVYATLVRRLMVEKERLGLS